MGGLGDLEERHEHLVPEGYAQADVGAQWDGAEDDEVEMAAKFDNLHVVAEGHATKSQIVMAINWVEEVAADVEGYYLLENPEWNKQHPDCESPAQIPAHELPVEPDGHHYNH